MGIVNRIKTIISRVIGFYTEDQSVKKGDDGANHEEITPSEFPESDDKTDFDEPEIESEDEAVLEEFAGTEEVVEKIIKSEEKAERIKEAIEDSDEGTEESAGDTEERGVIEDEDVGASDEIGEAAEEALKSEDGAETKEIDTLEEFEEEPKKSPEEAEEKDEEIDEIEDAVEEVKEEVDEESEIFEENDVGKEELEESDEDESKVKAAKEEEKPKPTQEVQISEALDAVGNRIPIEEADEDKEYICPKCSGLLIPRKGETRAPHFAHKPDESDSERGEAEKRQLPIFLGVSVHPFLQLFAEVSSLEWEDIDDPTALKQNLEKIQVDSHGVDGAIGSSTFRPEENNRVNLEADADRFQITVQSEGVFDAIGGERVADGLSPGDIFVGEETKARRIKSRPASVRNGQWVFSIVKKSLEDIADSLEIYKIGPWDALGAEVNDETFPLLKEHLEIERADKPGFDAYVVLPPDADPSTGVAFGKSSEDFLVGIQIPPKLDPELEVLLPGTDDHMVIAPIGKGQPRFYSSQFPKRGSQRAIFQGLGQNKEIQINARDEEEIRPWRDEPELCIRVGTEQKKARLNPIRGPTSVTLNPDIDTGSIDSRLVFEGPEGFQFDVVEARFPEDVDLPQVLRRRGVTFDEALEEIPYWMKEDCDRIKFHFGAAGTIEIGFGKPWEEDLSKEEIKERLREMDKLPQKARWPLVREVFRAPPGTPHIEFAGGKGGVKKRVRHALWEVQEEREDD